MHIPFTFIWLPFKYWEIQIPEHQLSSALPWEEGFKDMVTMYPCQITKIKPTFNRPGIYIWHYHILSHEDNEMMLPYCIGERDIDCPA